MERYGRELPEPKNDLGTLREELLRRQQEEFDAGGVKFLGVPERWLDPPGAKYRCPNDHVSQTVLKSEKYGADLCLACFENPTLTFPEDEDGPLNKGEKTT